MVRKILCTFPQKVIQEPILYSISQMFDVVYNLKGGTFSEELTMLSIELEGEPDEVDKVVIYLRDDKGVEISELGD